MIEKDFLKKIRKIEINSRRLVKEGLLGDYKSAFRGMGMQFCEFRNYEYGDDVRHIAWNVSARTQQPVIKIFEEERERSLFLLVDVSASLRKGPWAEAKAERLAEIAGTLALSASEAKDNLGLLLYSDQVEKMIPAATGRTHLLRIIRDVLLYEPKNSGTSPSNALKKLEPLLKKKSIIFLLSDMEKLPDLKIARRIASKHELIGMHIHHPKEWTLPNYWGFLELETAEQSRPVTLDTSSTKVKNYLSSFAEKDLSNTKNHFRKCGCRYLRINVDEDYVPPLRKLFRGR